MKLIKLIMFVFYRYYSKGGTKGIPYVSTLIAIAFLIYIHVFQLLIIFNKVDLLPMKEDQPKIVQYIKFASFFIPVVLIIGVLVKEKDLLHAEYEERLVKKSGTILVIYIALSIILLFGLMIAFPKK